MSTPVKERGFTAYPHEVRAILAGTQTQFRRAMKPQPSEGWQPHGRISEIHDIRKDDPLRHVMGHGFCNEDGDEGYPCPYGKPGDRLFVKETWRVRSDVWQWVERGLVTIGYEADSTTSTLSSSDKAGDYWTASDEDARRRSSTTMPLWASRITLEVESVRVQRVQEISNPDALAEGCELRFCAPCSESGYWPDGTACEDCSGEGRVSESQVFHELWDSTNAKRGYGWDTSPWVWAITFRRVEGVSQ